MGIIFDLDQTLINSSIALDLRRKRDWQNVYRLIPSLVPFEGINEILQKLATKNIPVCIVTSSPSSYCKKILDYYKWTGLKTVCYHDTYKHKPYPDPILKGVELLGVNPSQVISIGDEPNDIIASKCAGVISVAVTWGATDISKVKSQNPDYIFHEVIQLDKFLTEVYK
ncbi:HAD family hydrolase [Clostridium sp. YIM B02505]|uniref:HAD family hydrolase n=1 Tax=Clostridium yunnanense TaxID=2800325 RepID=A0ABS1EQA7_9CLOT|nr:HAD family hydrolase [Clostridium yunnanense]MBK1811547.1 HAD family hydrolase [Clostridium yunnanense]